MTSGGSDGVAVQWESSMKKRFHHTGVITDQKQPGEVFVPATRVWVTNPEHHPHRIEYLRFEPDSPVQGPVRECCHTAYVIEDEDLETAIRGANVLLGPFEALEGLTVVFIELDGAVIEYMRFSGGRTMIG
jgi:hypothetical protein